MSLLIADLCRCSREALAARGVHLWVFEQHEQEAVFVPAGAPHQVRNMRSCIKVRLNSCSQHTCVGVCVVEFSIAFFETLVRHVPGWCLWLTTMSSLACVLLGGC